MRFLSLRLKPKAAAMPRMGRGPGTDADDEGANVAVANVHGVFLLRPVLPLTPVLGLKTANPTAPPPDSAYAKKGPNTPPKFPSRPEEPPTAEANDLASVSSPHQGISVVVNLLVNKGSVYAPVNVVTS